MIALAMMALMGCERPEVYRLAVDDGEQIELLGVYIEPSPSLPVEIVMQGCGLWAPAGIRCFEVLRPEEARVRIYATEGPSCFFGGWLLAARAWPGRIVIYPMCMQGVYGDEFTDDALALIVAHEVGHVLGIGHVPSDCEDPWKTLHSGDGFMFTDARDLVCGPAVMNRMPFRGFDGPIGITTTDMDAFHERVGVEALFSLPAR